MKLICLAAFMAAVAPAVWADAATQTDWQGGPGIPGPVSAWNDRFDVASNLDWDTTPGQLKLIINTGINVVANGVDGASCAVPCDFDGDGDQDVVGIGRVVNSVYWWENLGGGQGWTQHLVGPASAPLFVTTADYDLDGDRDIMVAASGTNQIIYYENRGAGSWLPHVLESDFDAREIRSADFDGDGDFDIVGVSNATGDVVWWRNRLAQGLPWQKNYIDGALTGAYCVNTADVDNDGDIDVVAGSYTQDKLILYRNDIQFTGSWIKETVASAVGVPLDVALANLDSDPAQEIVVACWSASDVAVYDYSDTMGSWLRTNADTNLGGAQSVCTEDMDNDGKIDIVACGSTANDIVWYKNDGTGHGWTKTTVDGNFSGASSVATADMDLDGVKDIVSAGTNADQIAWWRVAGFSSPGVLQSSILDLGGGNVYWQFLAWSLDQPTYTQIVFNVRASNSSSDMGPWSADLTSTPSSLIGVLQDGCRFFQYLVTLTTTHPYSTPSLKDVTVLWSTWYGIPGDEGGAGSVLALLTPNPSFGDFTVQWMMDQPGNAQLSVYDVSGRVVRELASGWYDAGTRQTSVTGLPAGDYVISLQGNGFGAIRRVVVLP